MIALSNSRKAFVISCGWHTAETAWGPLTIDLADADTVETTLWAKDQTVAACLHQLNTARAKCNYWLCVVCVRESENMKDRNRDGDRDRGMRICITVCVYGTALAVWLSLWNHQWCPPTTRVFNLLLRLAVFLNGTRSMHHNIYPHLQFSVRSRNSKKTLFHKILSWPHKEFW